MHRLDPTEILKGAPGGGLVIQIITGVPEPIGQPSITVEDAEIATTIDESIEELP